MNWSLRLGKLCDTLPTPTTRCREIGAGTQEIRRMLIGRELFAETA